MHGRAAAGGPDRELAPAGADLEDPGAVGDAGLVEQALDLAALRLGEVGVVEERVGVVGGLWWSGDQVVSGRSRAPVSDEVREVSKRADE